MLLFDEIWIPNWVLYFSIILLLVYLHYVYNYSYWKSQGIKGPTPWPLIGTVNSLVGSTPSHEVESNNFKKYGPIYGQYEYSTKVLFINDSDLLKQIFVKDFDVFRNRRSFSKSDWLLTNGIFMQTDEDWKKARKLMSPMFSSGKLKKMSPIMMKSSKKVVEILTEKAKGEESFACRDVMRCFTVDILASCVFGIDVNAYDPNTPFVKYCKKVASPDQTLGLYLIVLAPRLASLLNMSVFSKDVTDYFVNLITKVFESRKNQPSSRTDFVQIMLEGIKENEGTNDEYVAKHLSYRAICAQSFALILAGFETTLSLLSLMSYHAAVYPKCQDRLIEEVDEACEKFGGICYDAVQEMPYLSAFVDETLRLYPAAIKGERVCSKDYQLGTVLIPKGAIVSFSEYVTHRNPKYWDDPEDFKPERFLNGPSALPDPYAYFPFLHGPRNCIAKRFALLEVKLCFAEIMTKLKFKKSPNTDVPLKFIFQLDSLLPERLELMTELRE